MPYPTAANIALLITSHQRGDMLLKILRQVVLQIRETGLNVIPIIAIDGPQPGYDDVMQLLDKEFTGKYRLIINPENGGKEKYWELINKLYYQAAFTHHAEGQKFEYLIQIPDDVKLAENFFGEAIIQFNAIKDPRKICLNLLNDGRTQNGCTRIEPKEVSYGMYSFIRTGWVDMCFISGSRFFENLQWKIKPISNSLNSNHHKSSGVGQQISQRLTRMGYNMYHTYYSLVEHATPHDCMLRDNQKEVALVSRSRQDKVIAGLATVPGRERSLHNTVRSIITQVDELVVTLNGHKIIPEFLQQPKIRVISDPGNTLGDAAKFAILGAQGYLLTLDDDLIYPADYVARNIDKIEQYERKALITHHGRIFQSFPISSYYHADARVVRCTFSNTAVQVLHTPGTGVSAWHSSTLPYLSLKDFPVANMSDVWLGLYCNLAKVPIIAPVHHKYWIVESAFYNRKATIHHNCHNHDPIQTLVMNSINWEK